MCHHLVYALAPSRVYCGSSIEQKQRAVWHLWHVWKFCQNLFNLFGIVIYCAVQLLKPKWTSPQTFQCTVFSVYRGSVIEERRHTTVGSEQTDLPVQILLCGRGSGLAWGIMPWNTHWGLFGVKIKGEFQTRCQKLSNWLKELDYNIYILTQIYH